MTWNPTNTDDVTLIVSAVERDEDGNRTGSTDIVETGAIVVDEFSIESDEDMQSLSGVGNHEALGISRGDVEHSFSFTVQGEDAEMFVALAEDGGQANELEIVAKFENYKDKLTRAYAGTRNVSGSSGDPVEFEVEGLAANRDPGTI